MFPFAGFVASVDPSKPASCCTSKGRITNGAYDTVAKLFEPASKQATPVGKLTWFGSDNALLGKIGAFAFQPVYRGLGEALQGA